MKQNLVNNYADDTNVFLDGEVSSLRALLTLFHNFEKLSGLKLNETKTKIPCIGNLYTKQKDFKAIFPHMDWVSEKMYILGVNIPLKTDPRKLMDWNLFSKLKEIKSTFNKWKKRNLTLYGKNVIIKSFGGASISYLLSVLPSPNENFFKDFSDVLKETGNNKIKLETLYKDLNEGGIKLLDIRSFDVALKMKWIKFLIEKDSNILSILMSRHFTNLKKITWQMNIKVSDLRLISKKYKQGVFICDVIRGWAEVNYKNITNIASTNELKNQGLWFNSHIRVQNKPIFNDKMVSKGIILVKDLMKNETCFIRIEKYADTMTVTLH